MQISDGWNMRRVGAHSRVKEGFGTSIVVVERLRRLARMVMPAGLYMMLGTLYNQFAVIRRLGYLGLRQLNAARTRGETPGEVIALDLPNLVHPLWVRPGTSDVIEVVHTVVRECYGKYELSLPPRFIVDAGANIGDSTCWFLSRYSEAMVIAIEPDPENFELLLRNTKPYGSRARCIKAGLWFRDSNLKVYDGGSKIAMYVQETSAANCDCEGLSPQSIVSRFNLPSLDIFKIDIEGAETQLFNGDTSWLAKCGLVYVDIHSKEAASAVATAAREHSLSCNRYRELCILAR